MLSASAVALQASAALTPTSTTLHATALPRVSSRLSALYQDYVKYLTTAAAKHGKPFVPPSNTGIPMNGGKVGVIAHAGAAKFSAVLRQLRALGMKVKLADSRYGDISGFLPISAIAKAGKLSGLTNLVPMLRPIVHTSGTVPNSADQSMGVELARQLYGVTGNGIKIGIISDSVAVADPTGLTTGEQTGELPDNVTIIRNSSGVLQDGLDPSTDTDEGRALMELIHDLAPDAALYFATGDGGVVNFHDNIENLLNAGCKVIVDDLSYESEPMFQEGLINQAVNDVVAAGGTYVSAVGNDGAGGYQRTAQFVNGPITLPNGNTANGTFVNFAPTGSPPDSQLKFAVSKFGDLTFQWDNPWDGNNGQINDDMDIFLYNANGSFFQSSTNDNSNSLGTGEPTETIFGVLPGTYELVARLTSVLPGTQPPSMYRMVLINGNGTGMSNFDYPGQIGSAYGHSAGVNTIAVGAVASTGTLTTSETYSSSGPVTELFDVNGNRLATPITLSKPDLSGVDHVTTSFFGDPGGANGSYYFNGTSAAAPNVAAVAALLYEYEPWAKESQILSALKSSASPLNGAAPGAWDPQGGYGLVNAAKALSFFDNTPPVAQVAPVLPASGAHDSAVISFSEPVFGLTLNDLTLTLNGGDNLLTAAQVLTPSADDKTYTLTGLSSISGDAGTYVLTAHADSNVTDYNGRNQLVGDAIVSWNSDGSAAVVGRWTFYNDSSFDGNDPGPNTNDNNAIAIDKTALLPGQTATFANYTSYTNGINGIMIDVARLPAGYTPDPADFTFKLGTVSDLSAWTAAPDPVSMTVLSGAGLGGSDRIDLIWSDQAITNKWLQVTMNAGLHTGLSSPDVFYFGNAVGESGNSKTDAAVTVADVLGARGRQSVINSFIYNPYDFNRDGNVDNADVLAARSNQTSAATALQLITPTNPPQPATVFNAGPLLVVSGGTPPASNPPPTRAAYVPPSKSSGPSAADASIPASVGLPLLPAAPVK